MDTTIAPEDLSHRPSPQPNQPVVNDGLSSASGIRWLHWIGALVVGVSMVGLLAARWGLLPQAVQFLVLVAGAVTLSAAGDVARHRLHLPATGSALYFLFTALVPLLAWGAAYLKLAETGFGLLSLVLGLVALLVSVRRVLVRVLDYRGVLYPASLGVLLFALPVLSQWGDPNVDPRSFFLIAAIGLGLILRFASRHINRFFFHRDRVAGVDRPIHFLPFALLALVYVAGMSLLPAAPTLFAVPLVFLAIALIDTGEEYFQALVQVTGQVPERWPPRSVGLLATGFGLMVVAVATAPVDNTFRAMALVTAIAALRLFTWALRYQRLPAYAFALTSALVAYHFSPMLIPQGVKHLFWQLVSALGISSGSSAVISLADLGALTGLVALGAVLKQRAKLTEAMERLHIGFLSFQGLVVLATALPDPSAARTLMPIAVLVLLAGLFLMRRAALIPIFQLALAHASVVWIVRMPHWRGWEIEALLALAAFNLAWAGAMLFLRHQTGRHQREIWLVGPTWLTTLILTVTSVAVLVWTGLIESIIISSAAALVLTGLTLNPEGSSWLARYARLARHEKTWWGVVFLVILTHPGAGSFCLALALVGLELTRAFRQASNQDEAPHPDSADAFDLRLTGWRLQSLIGVALIQAIAAGWITWTSNLAGLALVLAALGERVMAEALERRGSRIIAAPSYPMAWLLAAAAGVFSVVSTASASGSPWWPVLPGFLASLFFGFLAKEGYWRIASSVASMGLFSVSLIVLFGHLSYLGDELYWLAPGLALIGLSRLLEREIGRDWSERLFTVGATCLYAMPVLGLFEEITWGWQIVMLLLAISFGAASFRLRSRSLLTLSTAAVVIDLGFFLLKLGQTAPLLLWAVGIFFGLSLMGCATLLEYRRELLLQKVRIFGREIRSWA